jgi:hypothetical protein
LASACFVFLVTVPFTDCYFLLFRMFFLNQAKTTSRSQLLIMLSSTASDRVVINDHVQADAMN